MDGEKVAIAFELAADVDLATPASRLSSRGALSALPKKGGGEERPIRKRTSARARRGWENAEFDSRNGSRPVGQAAKFQCLPGLPNQISASPFLARLRPF